MQRKGVLAIAIALILMLALAGIFVAAMNSSTPIAQADPGDSVNLNADPGIVIKFYDYDGALLSSESYSTSQSVAVPSVKNPPEGWISEGWQCNMCDAVMVGDDVYDHILSSHGDTSLRFTNKISRSNNQEDDYDRITFRANSLGQNDDLIRIITIDPTDTNTVQVVYDIVKNSGVNNLYLIPDYDKTAFTLTSAGVTTKNNTVLGEATITGTEVNADEIRVVWESDNKYSATDAAFLTLNFTTNNDDIANGFYDFGLDLARSKAYRFVADGNSLGNQVEVPIWLERVGSQMIKIVRMQEAEIKIGYNYRVDNYDDTYTYNYSFEYGKAAVETEKVNSLTYGDENAIYYPSSPLEELPLHVYYTYKDAQGNDITANGGDVTRTWWEFTGCEDNDGWEEMGENVSPIIPGQYKVEIEAAASDYYYAVPTVTRLVDIVARRVTIEIADIIGNYGDAPVTPTYTVSGSGLCNGDALHGFSLSVMDNEGPIVITSTTKPGTYVIVPTNNDWTIVDENEDNQRGFYNVTVPNGTYEINKLTVTITVNDQSIEYKDRLITDADLTQGEGDNLAYTISGIRQGDSYEVVIGLDPGTTYESVGPYANALMVKSDGINREYYDVPEPAKGTLTITSATKDTAYFESFFDGDTVTYDGEPHNLLIVKNNAPEEWWQYQPSNNSQTNAGTYTNITVTITVKSGYTSYYTISDGQVVLTVTGKINKKAVTFTANDVNVYYGQAPVTPNFSVSGTSEEINYTYAIKDNNVAFTPTASTAVGNYPIVLTAGSNPNFEVTYVDGVYHVNKANASASVNANDVYYNRGALDYTASASVNTLSLTPVVKFYSDNTYETEVTPVNAGTYYVKATVAGTDNYNGAQATDSFEIKTVKLEGVTFTYSHGNVTWTAVANDTGKTSTETGVTAAALKEGTAITYKVYDGNTLKATIASNETRTFDADANTVYAVEAYASDANYTYSRTEMNPSYQVIFNGNINQDVTNMPDPATVYVFQGQTVSAPANEPSTSGNSFSFWSTIADTQNASYDFTTSVTANITLYAIWGIDSYKITLKYTAESTTTGTDVFEYTKAFDTDFSYDTNVVVPVKSPDGPHGAGITYAFNNTWVNAADATDVITSVDGVFQNFSVPAEDRVYIAQYTPTVHSFTVTYLFYNTDEGEYQQDGETQSVDYGAQIVYRSYDSDIMWFAADYWYGDAARTQSAPTVMSDIDINVYGAYKFDIGYGDVNGNGVVNSDDITLYRQWIVGGYSMEVVAIGDEWETSKNYDSANRYFLMRVADIDSHNAQDGSKDIRDVSIIRMSIVGGYSWDIFHGYNVSGDEIMRNTVVTSVSDLVTMLQSGNRTTIASILTSDTDVQVVSSGDMYLDLNGYGLTVKSFSLTTSGNGATITVKNGTIITDDGVEISAPNGNVVIEDVDAYDADGEIALQAASSSLHFFGDVAFYKATNVELSGNGTVAADNNSTVEPATLMIAEDTHVVVEPAADLQVEKLVVYVEEDNVKTVLEASAAELSIDIMSEETSVIQVVADTITHKSEESIPAKFGATVSTVAEFNAAIAAGKSVKLAADLEFSSYVYFTNDVEIDLDVYSVNFTGWGFLVGSGKMTITGKATSNVTAVNAAIYVYPGAHLVVNGGNYRSTTSALSVKGGASDAVINDGAFVSTNSYAIGLTNGAELIVKDGYFEGKEGCVVAFSGSSFVIDGGEYHSIDNSVFSTNGTAGEGNNNITINDGEFYGGIQTANNVACGIYVANNDTVTVNGGVFHIDGGIGIMARSGITTVKEEVEFSFTNTNNLTAGKVGDKKLAVPVNKEIVMDLSLATYPGGIPVIADNGGKEVYVVAKNVNDTVAEEGTFVTTFAELNTASGCVVLGADITTVYTFVFEEDVVLYLNNHTIKNTYSVALIAENGAKMTINGSGNVYSQEMCVMAFSGSEIVINGGTYTSYDNAVVGTNGTKDANNDFGHNTITINAGTFNGFIETNGYVACGIYVANSDTVTVNGGTFNVENGCGILARSGNTTVKAGVVFNVTGDGSLGKVGDSNVTVPTGEELVLDTLAGYPGGTPTLTNNTSYEVYVRE